VRLITNIGRVTAYGELFKALHIIPLCILKTLCTQHNWTYRTQLFNLSFV